MRRGPACFTRVPCKSQNWLLMQTQSHVLPVAARKSHGPQLCLRSGAIPRSACLPPLAGLHGALTGTTIAGVGELAGAGSDPARY